MQFAAASAPRATKIWNRNWNLVGSLTVVLGAAALASSSYGQTVQSQTAQGQTTAAGAREKLVGHAAVEAGLAARGITAPRVLAAMRKTPQFDFIPIQLRRPNTPQAAPIGFQQTISSPFRVAAMAARLELKPSDKVLEIGTGSGYQSAVFSLLAKEVYTIEIVEPLGKAAARRLTGLGYRNVQCKIGDGCEGWAEHAPFDKIMVDCSPEQVPQPLVDQLAEGGLMLIPVGTRFQQTLCLLKKEDGKLVSKTIEPTLFDPMTGAADDQRTELEDVSLTDLLNGGFEAHALFPLQPDGWHDLRQGRLDGSTLAGHGQSCLTFSSAEPGRDAHALQGVAVDGRQVPLLQVSALVRCQNAQAGLANDQAPQLRILYFDEKRALVGQSVLGPWTGSFPWTPMSAHVPVPTTARTAILAIGLLGGTGEVSLDDVELLPAPLNTAQAGGVELKR